MCLRILERWRCHVRQCVSVVVACGLKRTDRNAVCDIRHTHILCHAVRWTVVVEDIEWRRNEMLPTYFVDVAPDQLDD